MRPGSLLSVLSPRQVIGMLFAALPSKGDVGGHAVRNDSALWRLRSGPDCLFDDRGAACDGRDGKSPQFPTL